jgi:ATP-dependent helicase/nuclease subunit B
MALTLVLGPANSAKAGEVLGAYAAATRRGAVLVVPTRLDATHYVRELAADGTVLGSVLTFAGLAREIAQRAQYSGRRLSGLQRERVLRGAVDPARLAVLGPSAGAPGFLAAAGELIAELERELVTPQRFAGALRSWAAADPRRGPYAESLGRLYLDYGHELYRIGRVDSELYAWRALDALRAEPGRWGSDSVYFYGFDELTALERDAVETLSRVVGAEVTVSLTYEPGRPALAARAEAAEELRPLAERVIELPALDEHYAPGSRAALHHLERQLFGPASEPLDPGAAVRLLESGGERAEAELVAGEVLALLRSGMPGEEIVVVYRSVARAAPLVTRVFEQYGLAVASRYELPFVHSALGRAVHGLARCAFAGGRGARAEDLLAYLRCPGLLERPEIADRLEATVRREGLSTAAEARERFGWELEEIDSLACAEHPAAELRRNARRLFAAPHRRRAPTLTREEELDARALGALLGGLDELDELGQRLSGAELIEVLEELTVSAGAPASPGAVLLAEPLEIRARRFRAVFVCGLQEGEFPTASRPEPFLSDERRRELAICSGLRLRPREDSLGRERYLLYACLSRATEQVVISYRSSDEEGNLALASPFVTDVTELFTEQLTLNRRRRLLADVVWPAEEAPTARELARTRAAAGAAVAGELREPVRSLSEQALAHVRHSRVLSAGALEGYADCPVRWLVERELQPAPFEPDSDPVVRGNLIHEALERLIGRLGGPITEDSLQRANEILDELLAELAGREDLNLARGRPPALRAAALRAIEADLRRYLGHEARSSYRWRVRGLELRFGFGAADAEAGETPSLPPLELGDGDQQVLIRGMIDRIDVDDTGHAIVRDYKSGTPRPDWPAARWSVDRRLQVALYMLVVRELLGLEPVGGFYQPFRGEHLRARGIYLRGTDVGTGVSGTDARDPEELEAELDAAATRAIELALALRAGELHPCPQTCSRNGCAYPGICRSQ